MMKSVLLWLLLIPVLSLSWWFWANRRLHFHQSSRLTKRLLTLSMLVFFVGYAWVVLGRDHLITTTPPTLLLAIVLLWGLIFLPFVAMPLMTGWAFLSLMKAIFKKRRPPQTSPSRASHWSRRKWLGGMATLLPVFGTYGTALISMRQIRRFRVHEKTLIIPELPLALDGLRIAHVSDTHVGKFTTGHVIDEIIAATNQLDADLVLFTGDLIDYSLRALPEALQMMQRFRAKSGVYLVEGNHDLMDDPVAFETQVRAAGLNFLRNQAAHLQVRGVALDLLGVAWSFGAPHMAMDVAVVAALRDRAAFPILLSHHPHAFDHAVEHGIPLTLAGHTHGGQLMMSSTVGVGPAMFRYWTGLYQKAGKSLWVSNGVGNWFPIRVNAPAEIVHLTLRCA